MGRSIRYLESSATPEEDSYDYRVEWDDKLGDYNFQTRELEHYGAGSRCFTKDFDNAWDCFCDLCDNPNYRGIRLIKIDSNGNESVRDRK